MVALSKQVRGGIGNKNKKLERFLITIIGSERITL
jgi:hypothetical protein